MSGARTFTVVAFHAHPDDEALLTGGTLARAAAEGHRVVLVTATRGERGLADGADGSGERLAQLRMAELRESARALGCARVLWLGYQDSGMVHDPGDTEAFACADVNAAAARLARILREEHADVLTTYDRNGGYGHPDHVQVHRVGTAAARLAGTPVVLEATVSAGLFRAVLHALDAVGHTLGTAPLGTGAVFSSRRQITHRVVVRRFLGPKRAAMAAHRSQARADGRPRTLDAILRLPLPIFGIAFGREWFVEAGARPSPGRRKESDVFATLRLR